MTRQQIIDEIGHEMDDLNESAAKLEPELLDPDISPHDRLVNFDAVVNRLRRFATKLEGYRKHIQ